MSNTVKSLLKIALTGALFLTAFMYQEHYLLFMLEEHERLNQIERLNTFQMVWYLYVDNFTVINAFPWLVLPFIWRYILAGVGVKSLQKGGVGRFDMNN